MSQGTPRYRRRTAPPRPLEAITAPCPNAGRRVRGARGVAFPASPHPIAPLERLDAQTLLQHHDAAGPAPSPESRLPSHDAPAALPATGLTAPPVNRGSVPHQPDAVQPRVVGTIAVPSHASCCCRPFPFLVSQLPTPKPLRVHLLLTSQFAMAARSNTTTARAPTIRHFSSPARPHPPCPAPYVHTPRPTPHCPAPTAHTPRTHPPSWVGLRLPP